MEMAADTGVHRPEWFPRHHASPIQRKQAAVAEQLQRAVSCAETCTLGRRVLQPETTIAMVHHIAVSLCS